MGRPDEAAADAGEAMTAGDYVKAACRSVP